MVAAKRLYQMTRKARRNAHMHRATRSLSREERAAIKKLVTKTSKNAFKKLAKTLDLTPWLKRSARGVTLNGVSAKEKAAGRIANASQARAVTAKRVANAAREARAEPELDDLADRLAATLNTGGPKKTAPTHHLATSAERRRRLATVAEGENE
jgi:hypothetical protein